MRHNSVVNEINWNESHSLLEDKCPAIHKPIEIWLGELLSFNFWHWSKCGRHVTGRHAAPHPPLTSCTVNSWSRFSFRCFLDVLLVCWFTGFLVKERFNSRKLQTSKFIFGYSCFLAQSLGWSIGLSFSARSKKRLWPPKSNTSWSFYSLMRSR